VIIDAHHHLWDLGRGYPWLDDPALGKIRRTFTVEDLRAELSANGIDYTVLVEAGRCTAEETTEFLELAEATPEIAGVVGWCDITAPLLPASDKLVGARDQVQGQPDPEFLVRQDVQAGLRALAAQGLAFDLVVRPDQLPSAATVAANIPELTFVLDHMGKPSIREGRLAEWRAMLTPLAERPNVYAKLSGLVTEADWETWTPTDLVPVIDAALELFGPERLMFGSDWPVCLLAASYHDVKGALDEAIDQLSQSEKDAIYAGTAIRAYGLEHLLLT
jgi:L-fuconolactonase